MPWHFRIAENPTFKGSFFRSKEMHGYAGEFLATEAGQDIALYSFDRSSEERMIEFRFERPAGGRNVYLRSALAHVALGPDTLELYVETWRWATAALIDFQLSVVVGLRAAGELHRIDPRLLDGFRTGEDDRTLVLDQRATF